MNWLKDVVVDLVVTLFIALAVWLGDVWMWWVIAIYTILLVIAKGTALNSNGMLSLSQKNEQAPGWFFHLLYGINLILLGYAGWWYLFAGWCLIWLFSYLSQRK